MPLYAYSCATCFHEFDEIRSVDERGKATCPKCGGWADKQVTVPGLVRDDPTNWASENGGRGRYITQLQQTLGSKVDKNAFCTSRQEARDKAHRRGLVTEVVA